MTLSEDASPAHNHVVRRLAQATQADPYQWEQSHRPDGLAEIELSCDGGHGADQERDRAGDASPKRIPFDLAEAKNQERPYGQDHEHDKPDQENRASRMSVFDRKIGRDRPQRQCIKPP